MFYVLLIIVAVVSFVIFLKVLHSIAKGCISAGVVLIVIFALIVLYSYFTSPHDFEQGYSETLQMFDLEESK